MVSTEPLTVGVVGAGRMGAAAVRRLVEEGFSVTVANRTRPTSQTLAREVGCGHADTFAELAAASDVVLVLTAGEEGTRQAVVEADGLLAGARAGTTVLVMSTVTPSVIHELAHAAAIVEVSLVDVPISGRPAELSKGAVSLFAGGPPEVLERVSAVLLALGNVIPVGPTGAAAAMKLGVNAVVFGLVAAVAECLALTGAAGVAPGMAYDVLQQSAVGSKFIDLRRPYFVNDDPPAVQFSMDATRETLELIVKAAASLSVVLPQTETNLATARTASESGLSDQDLTQLARFLLSRRSDLPRGGDAS